MEFYLLNSRGHCKIILITFDLIVHLAEVIQWKTQHFEQCCHFYGIEIKAHIIEKAVETVKKLLEFNYTVASPMQQALC